MLSKHYHLNCMESLSLSFLFLAFIAGFLVFLAPCTLPMVPAYLGFISGVSQKELQNPTLARFARKKIFYHGLVLFWGFLSFLYSLVHLREYSARFLLTRGSCSRAGGVLIILF